MANRAESRPVETQLFYEAFNASPIGIVLENLEGQPLFVNAFFCAMLIYQHLLVKPNDLSRVNFAFMTTNGIASVVFAVFFLLDRLWIR